MINNKSLRSLLGLFAMIFYMFGMQTAVHAESYNVPMQVLENGSSNTSYAAAYFSHAATVTPNGNNTYTVTSTVTTGKDLGNYPVQVLNIDGAGANVSRSQSGNSQTITYSFVTSNLSARHNAAIKVDVNSINYHHNYIVGLVLDTSKVPAPAASSSSTPASTSSQQATSSQQSNSSVAVSSASESVPSSTTQNDADATNTSVANSKSSSSAKVTSKSKTKTQVAKEKHEDKGKQLPVVAIVGGGLVLGIILGLVFNLKKKK
ncbi:NEAT domain-containing protein [Weissella sagaensis]|uniref:NEAT domain-containing protein n=1 Tax=Weissella sagaensis TaxID=2559928 RepID=UPI0035120B7B